LLDNNFDTRRALYRISEDNIRMVETARKAGASAKFSGSGGAIVGTYRDEPMFDRLCELLEPLGVVVVRPEVVGGEAERWKTGVVG
jgi:glucuronokinase